MIGIGIAELVIVGLLVTVPLVLLFLMIYAFRRSQQGSQGLSPDDAQAIRELLQGLKRLEERMDSLETILLERKGKG